ncbi:IS4 family transposase, partial [Terasakiella sp. A23]|uniref:IS4 family transposase n=1 Tax=Terasakiella sp. FCG-A23 TaxID=3080561 RepID=UPI002953182A
MSALIFGCDFIIKMGYYPMENASLYLPGLHWSTLRRKPRSALQKLVDETARIRRHSLSQLGDCFSKFIPMRELDQRSGGSFSRRRLYSKTNTFWAFFSQILDADGGCQEVVRKVQAFAGERSMKVPSASTSAYCQARHKLDESMLEKILSHTSKSLRERSQEKGWKGRRVIVVDGTGVSMADTPDNQHVWPQPKGQQPGCGFPQGRVCACFCLHTGALLSYRLGDRKRSELPMLRQQWSTFNKGDVFLGDKGFCSYYDVWKLQQFGVDSVLTLARRTPVDAASAIEVLGKNDLLIQWPKPLWNKQHSYGRAEWEALPDVLTLRQIKVEISAPGYRTKSFYLVTTMTDPEAYPVSELAALYYQRWDVELFFRDIKTTMGMDILRCKTPPMVRKEILMHFIAYNAIRLLMFDAAGKTKQPPRRLSFKATIQALRQWEPLLNRRPLKKQERCRLMNLLYEAI